MKVPIPVVILAVGAAAAAGVDALADLTQTRPDVHRAGTRSEVVMTVRTRQPFRTPHESAQALWGACQGTVGHELLDPGVVPTAGGQFRFVVRPALGTHARDRLTGCIEDTTLDRVKGHVVSIRELTR